MVWLTYKLMDNEGYHMRNALFDATRSYAVHKRGTVRVKYLYLESADAERSVDAGRLVGTGTYEVQTYPPYAAPVDAKPWFIVVDSSANLNGAIDVIAWGRAIRS